MTSLALSLCLLGGLVLIYRSLSVPHASRPTLTSVSDLLAEAGLPQATPLRLLLVSVASGVMSGFLVLLVSKSLAISGALGVLALLVPLGVVRHRRRSRRDQLRAVWPDAIEHLASGVRAGLSLPEALGQIGLGGPEPLRPYFAQFAEDYRVSGRYGESLDVLKSLLADPVGDRVVEALRLAREVGGQDLGRLLRTLAAFLRDDARTRGELESRQSWTVNAARLAVAAPWALLLLLSLRPQAVAAYDSTAGLVVLAFGAGVSVFAYRLMIRLGRLPQEQRVLR